MRARPGASQLQLSGHPELEGQCRSGDLFLRRIDQESTRLKPTPLLCSNGPLSKGHDPFQTELSEVLCSARGLSTSATETLPVRMEVKGGGGGVCLPLWLGPPSSPLAAGVRARAGLLQAQPPPPAFVPQRGLCPGTLCKSSICHLVGHCHFGPCQFTESQHCIYCIIL